MKSNKPSLYKGAEEALVYTTQTRFHEDGDMTPRRIRTHDEEMARELMAIEKTMHRLTSTQRPLFHWPIKIDHHSQRLCRGRLANHFLHILRPNLASIRQTFPYHQFHPLVALFEDHMEANAFSAQFSPTCKEDVDRLNACVSAIRQAARSQRFRFSRDKHHKLIRSNTVGLLELIDRLFAAHSQLLVVRMDISYLRHPVEAWRSFPVMMEEALAHRREIIHYLRRKCPFKPVGYAWKLEFTEHTGWHTHLLLFYDANHHQQDFVIADHIGKHWNRVITGGNGRYYICNYESYLHRGVGKIHYSDTAKLWALRTLVAPYLTKADYYARMVLSVAGSAEAEDRALVRKSRTFGRSELPDAPVKKLGRPRALPSARVADYLPSKPRMIAKLRKKVPTKRCPISHEGTYFGPLNTRRLPASLAGSSLLVTPLQNSLFGSLITSDDDSWTR
ncbi:YagK/YfjJ domain-containing protein [Dyella caseinilytica]|uniref:Inovirus-type Gp2 protein n=1 Tax=Dyella caseinilytica TaxID=1849581 RepID=A0ABX7GUI2_9GAMM|nr:inovirus-type Gp2 protein [Dyella caseinilytica]QRN53544.1 inovirus-type Gp2 protein [Dyella caseinilytica]GFZ87196.1 hypothetical protein GCM10011408_02350 [Dyella caseinilytica]